MTFVTQKFNTSQVGHCQYKLRSKSCDSFYSSETWKERQIRRGGASAPCVLESVVVDWLNSCVTCTWVTIYCRDNKQLLACYSSGRKGAFHPSITSFWQYWFFFFFHSFLERSVGWLIDSSRHLEKWKFKFLLPLIFASAMAKGEKEMNPSQSCECYKLHGLRWG